MELPFSFSFLLSNIFFSLLFTICSGARSDEVSTITPTNEGSDGVWKTMLYCPFGSYALGYRMRVDEIDTDKSGVNDIELQCYDYNNALQGTINSFNGLRGTWYSITMCVSTNVGACSLTYTYRNFMKGVQTKLADQSLGVTGFVGQCLNEATIESAGGMAQGTLGTIVSCPAGTAICGIQVKFEDDQGAGDDSAINNVRASCCRICDLSGALYLSGNTCAYCHYSCKTCTGGASTECTSCYFTSTNVYTLTSGSCVPPSCNFFGYFYIKFNL
jgi:hypothetical protein